MPDVTVRCDWFSAVFPPGETFRVVGWLEDRLGRDSVELGSVRPYPYNLGCVVEPHGYVKFKGRMDEFQQPHYDDFPALVELGGQCLAQLSWDALASFWYELRGIGARCVRIDLCVDDFLKRVNFRKLRRAAERGDYSPFRCHSPMGDASTGQSVSFGKKGKSGGGVSFTIYEKDKESEGRVDSHRLEAKFWKPGNAAQNAWGEVFDTPPGGGFTDEGFFVKRAFELVGGSLRLPTCRFMKQIFGDVPTYRASDPPKPPNEELEKAWQNLIRSAMPSLAAVRLHYVNQNRENEFDLRLFTEMVAAEERFSKHHLAIAGQPQKEQLYELPF